MNLEMPLKSVFADNRAFQASGPAKEKTPSPNFVLMRNLT